MNTKDKEVLLKAFANQSRLRILDLLFERGGLHVADIADNINLSFQGTSKNLRTLEQVGLLESERRMNEVYYKLKKPLMKITKVVLNG